MRNTYQNVSATLARFAALARADLEADTASKAASLLTAGGITKDNGKVFTAHDVRQWRSINKTITDQQRAALVQAHLSLQGTAS